MKRFFPDSFGVAHKVNKQKVKVVCLDLTKEDHLDLVEQWALSGKCLSIPGWETRPQRAACGETEGG